MILMRTLLPPRAVSRSSRPLLVLACILAALLGQSAVCAAAEAHETPRKPAPATAKPATPPPPAKPNATANPTPATPGQSTNWQSLFDGKTLTGWKEADFAGRGAVKVESGRLLLDSGIMTGVTWTNDLPRMNYEI